MHLLVEPSSPNRFNIMECDERMEDRLQLAYAWYRRLDFPGKEVMKYSISHVIECDISSADIDLLPWNKTETKVVNDDWIYLEDPPADLFAANDFSESSETSYTSVASMTFPPSDTLSLSPRKHASVKDQDQDQRRKKCYKWYKLLAKPTRETMCRIAEYTKGSDFTRQDVDLLRWNFEETMVVKEANRRKRPGKHEKGSQHDKDAVFEVDFPDIMDNDSKGPKARLEDEAYDNLKSLHSSTHHSRTHHMDETFHTCYEDGARYESEKGKFEGEHSDRLEIDRLEGLLHRTNIVEEEHKRKKEERLLKREAAAAAEKNKRAEEEHKRKRKQRLRKREAAATEKSMSGEDAAENHAGADNREAAKRETAGIDNSEDARRERAFRWYSQFCTNRADFKRRVAALESMDITSEDIDLLPWNESGSVVNIAKMNALMRANLVKLVAKQRHADKVIV
jgi:hypothetical protein